MRAFLWIFLWAFPLMTKADSVTISSAYARPTKGTNGALFMDIENPEAHHIKLISAETNVCGRVELHTHLQEGPIYRMRKIPYIAINPGSTVSLKPGGLHIMLMHLDKELEEGKTLSLTLTFEGKERFVKEITLPIRKKKSCGCCAKKKKAA